MTRRIPTWSEIVKAGDAFDIKSFDDMADAAAQNPIDTEQVKTGSKARVHEGYASGAKSTFDPEKFVPVKNGDDGKFAPGTGFYFTNLGADGLSDYYHDHSKIYANSDGSELDRSGVAFTLDPKTHISIRNNNDYRKFLQKYPRFYDYSKGEGNPIWGVLPDWEAAAKDGVGSVQFPYESLKHTDGGELYGEYWSGPNGERGQPQYIYNHPNEGLILRPEAVVTQRPYKFFEEKDPNAKDESTADRHLAGLTPDGKKFMEEVYERQYSNPRELKFWHGYARTHPEMSLEELRNEYGGLLKSVKSAEGTLDYMTDYPDIPSWDQIAKSKEYPTVSEMRREHYSGQTCMDVPCDALVPNTSDKNAWQFGAEAGARAKKLKADAQALGNTQMDTQKDLYDRATRSQKAHDAIPKLIAIRARAVNPKAKPVQAPTEE